MKSKMQRTIKVLLADSTRQFFHLRKYIEEWPETELCGEARDGDYLLQLLKQGLEADVMILDAELRRRSGAEILHTLPSLRLRKIPKIIVTTCTTDELVQSRYIAAGAQCLAVKPYRAENLLLQAESLCLSEQEFEESRLKYLVRLHLEKLHLTVGDIGYWYLMEAAGIMAAQQSPCSLSKDVYEAIADRYKVSAKAVESGVRRAIEQIHHMDSPEYQKMQRYLRADTEKPLSNSNFLGRLAQQVAVEWG